MRRDFGMWLKTLGFPLILCLLILTTCITYNPKNLQLNATDPGQYFVTSTTPNATDNNFYNAESGFNSPLQLRQCSLYNDTDIGLVKDASEEGNAVLDAIFDEINNAFKSASEVGMELYKLDFESRDDMDKYVKDKSYRENSFCFALGWQKFDPSNNQFVIDISYNFGDIYENRLPQTFYENSLYCDFFLWQQGNMGFLQAMTSVTNKIISEVYKVPSDSYNFQIMYMPMNTSLFHNDFYWEYIGATLPIVYLAVVKLSDSIISAIGGKYEHLIQESLKRAGMRKSVELYLHGLLTIICSVFLFPLVIYITIQNVFYDFVSNGLMIEAVVLFVLNYITQYHVVMFALPESWSGRVNKALEILAIVFLLQSVFLKRTAPWFVYITSFFPIDFISWFIRFGMRAYNREVEFRRGVIVFNGIDLGTIMDIGWYTLLAKSLIIIYCWPVQISGDIDNQNGYFYMCNRSWWKSCCKNYKKRTEDNKDAVIIETDNTEEFYIESAMTGYQLSGESGFGVIQKRSNLHLLKSEIALIASGDYEELAESKSSCKSLQLENIIKKIGDKIIIDDLSLTCFRDEIFVIIGENGAGKTSILESIAGNHSGLEGKIIAHDKDIKSWIRFLDDFIAFQRSESITIKQLTVEEHIEFYCRFRGISDQKRVINETLANFDLKSCSNIVADRVSNNQKKKLNVALALLGNSQIILLDEPTAGLDIVNKRQVWDQIIKAKNNRIVIVVTQDMQEAQILGQRIGLMQKGQMKKVGSPEFFKKFYKASPTLVFTFRDKQQYDLRSNELREVIMNAVKPQHLDKVSFNLNELDQLIFRVPSNISWQKMNTFVDMDALIAKQGDLFEQVQLKKPTIADTFNINKTIDIERIMSDEIPKIELKNSVLDEELMNDQNKWCRSLKIMLEIDFMTKSFRREFLKFLFIFLLTILQEAIFLAVQLHIPQETLNYSNISSIFEGKMPLETYKNRYDVNGVFTRPLFNEYKNVQNLDEEQVLFETWSWPILWPPAQSLTVNQTLTRIGKTMNGTLDEEEIITSNFTRPLGAYYVYSMDEDTHNYSIAIYSRQYSAASGPVYGATMLETLASRITNQQISIDFNSRPLPRNNPSFPSVKTSVAEIFSISLLTASTLLMMEQVNWYGSPMETGLYQQFLIKGGYMSTYFLSKYIKCIIFNALLITIWAIIKMCFRMEVSGAFSIICLWIFFNPFFIFAICNFVILKRRLRYKSAQAVILLISSFLGVILYLRSGIIAFGYDQVGFFQKFLHAFLIFPTNQLVGASEWGFLFRRYQVWTNWGDETVELSPYRVFHSYWYRYMIAMVCTSIFYGSFMALIQYYYTFRGRIAPKQGIKELEEDNKRLTKDVKEERKSAIRVSKAIERWSKIIDDDSAQDAFDQQDLMESNFSGLNRNYAIVVTQLQCWKSLSKKDIGPYNKHSVVHNQGWGKLGLYSVKDVSFCVNEGERFVILGSASSGRTSMIKNILGQERILKGEIQIADIPSKELYRNPQKIHGLIGYQPQIDCLSDKYSVKQQLTFFAKLAGVQQRFIKTRVDDLMKSLYLKEQEDNLAEILSDGFKKRLSLGIALIGQPKIVILDDPLAGVDPATTQALLGTIRTETENSTLLVCTNSVDVAEALAQKLAIMHEGKIIAIGKISELMKLHGGGYTIELQINLPLLESSMIPILDYNQFGLFIDSEEQAVELLRVLYKHLEDLGKEISFNFEEEFDQEGVLENLLDDVQLGVQIPVNIFMQKVLIQNITKYITDDLRMRYGMGVTLNSIQASQVRISIKTHELIQRQQFKDFMDQLVKMFPISFYTIQETTLDQVFSKLISKGQNEFFDGVISVLRPSMDKSVAVGGGGVSMMMDTMSINNESGPSSILMHSMKNMGGTNNGHLKPWIRTTD